jgi:DnaJ-class molecular chaperone
LQPDHYATLGLDQSCTADQIRSAYRLLAKQLHPDVNGAAAGAVAQMQQINAAYEVLVDEERRAAYDTEVAARARTAKRGGKQPALAQDIYLQLREFFAGTTLEVRVNDPAAGALSAILEVPPATAPGSRFKVVLATGTKVAVRVRARPDQRFKVRGSDLRCDLRISTQRAAQGGTESVAGANGNRLCVNIPRGVQRGEILRLAGEGLPRPRGGRGDLLIRVLYRLEILVRRASRR